MDRLGRRPPGNGARLALGLFADLAGRADSIRRDLPRLVIAQHTLGVGLAALRAHRDHQAARNELPGFVGTRAARDERDLIVGEPTGEKAVHGVLRGSAVREHGDHGHVFARDVDLLWSFGWSIHADLLRAAAAGIVPDLSEASSHPR